MTFTDYSIVPDDGTVVIDGTSAYGVDMTGIPATVHSIQWNGLRSSGSIEYKADPETGVLPDPGSFLSASDYSDQTDEALAIIDAYQNPVSYYYISPPPGVPLGAVVSVNTVGWPQPPGTTTLVPPSVNPGQTLQWNGSAWVVASFDITLPLADAKTSLINTTEIDAAAAVNAQSSIYSGVQLITAPDVNALETQTYPGTTLGQYQTYVDGLTASTVAQINAATTVPDLYPINPATIPFTPTASGTISGSRTGNDFNDSYYVTFNSTTLTEADTELFIPSTSTVIPYILPTQFAGTSEAFSGGNYTVQIRQSSTGFVLAQYTCPAGPPDVVVPF